LIASLALQRIALEGRLLRRRWPTKTVSARSCTATAARDPVLDCSARCARSARIARWSPPASSSLADEKRVGSLLLSTAARDPRIVL